jgi:hypothetical protein
MNSESRWIFIYWENWKGLLIRDIKKGYIYEKDGTKKIIKNNEEIYTGNLSGKIFGLYEHGHIVFSHALILQKIKGIGNDALHNIIEPNSETLKKTIHIVETVLDIYMI